MELKKIFSQVRALIHNVAGASLSFGAASQVGDASVIPVAKIVFGFGGGGGKGGSGKQKPAKKAETEVASEPVQPSSGTDDFGGGVGGAIKTEPIGIFVIQKDKVRFYPILTLKELLAFSSFALWVFFKIWRLKRLKKR